ncbi:MAG TPA: cysteine desulfurase family protein [Candidatus Dormibacteraeota bacterium]|nr:cysteine desulfurase family protein [Candidatus Dormibacteraeota bacterium]
MLRIYLDNNATTPVLPEVLEAMRPYFSEHFGNASSIHHHGQETRAAVERARDSVASLLGCRPGEVVFTSGGTEGDNLTIAGLTSAGDHVITSTIEHHAVMLSCKHLEENCDVTYVPVDGRGLVDPDDVRHALRPNTRLISIMMANNETGVLQPVEEIGKIAADAEIYFHTDAVQAAGKVPVDVDHIGCDALSISGHKMHAPQGVGALYVRKGTRLQPLFYGGRHERSRRAGTENVPGIVALGKAAELARQGFERGDSKKMSALRDRLQQGILAQVEDAAVNGAGAPRVPNTSNIHFDHIEGESMVISLDLKGLAVSTGAACSSGAIEPSHVLTAMGLRSDQARASIRFSLGKQNTAEDIDVALALVPETVARLRELSPAYRKQTVSFWHDES